MLQTATDGRGGTPLPWIAAPIRQAERALDLRCGIGALAGELAPGRWLGLDVGPVPPRDGAWLRGTADAVPLRACAVDAVCLTLLLPLLENLDAVFAEIRRVLRPGGTLVALVPSATLRSWADLQDVGLLRAARRDGWPNRSGLDHASWLLAAADFAVLGDDRGSFQIPVPDAASAAQVVADLHTAGVWSPRASPGTRRALTARLAGSAGPGRVVPVPLRRLVARR
nr:methyltransferase domain-containing protein [Pseudonocardia acidicola]